MQYISRPLFLSTSLIGALAGAAASTSHAGLDAAGTARLEALHAAPDSAGALIYDGTVYAQQAAGAAPLFSYQRRVGAGTSNTLSSAHITRDPQGRVIIAEQAEFGAGYALQRFEAANMQAGYSGAVVLRSNGRRLDYRLNDNGKVTTASEEVDAPVVSGPTLHGFILHHWDALSGGTSIPVRMIVMASKTTYGFDIGRRAEVDGRTIFSVTPSSWLVRLAVAPLTVTFDAATRNVLRYEGQVPPMREDAGKLRTLVARVDYVMKVPTYR